MAATSGAETEAIRSKAPLTDCNRRTPGILRMAPATTPAVLGWTVSMTKAWICACSWAWEVRTA